MSKETWLPHYRSSSTKLSLGPRHGRAHFWSHIWTKLQWFIHKIGHDFHFISGIKSTLLLNFVSKSGKCPGIPLEISRFKNLLETFHLAREFLRNFPHFPFRNSRSWIPRKTEIPLCFNFIFRSAGVPRKNGKWKNGKRNRLPISA